MALITSTSDLRNETLRYLQENDPDNDISIFKSSGALGRRLKDTERIAKFIASGEGIEFAAGQTALLAAQNITKQSRLGLVDITKEIASFIGAILAQVPVNGTGTHFSTYELAAALTADDSKYYYLGERKDRDALYRGEITIKRTNRMKGKRALDSFDKTSGYGFASSGVPDKVGTKAVLFDEEELKAALGEEWDPVPVLFSIPGQDNSFLPFRGFIQNIADSYSPTWNSNTFVGRGEPVFTYSGTNRTLSFSLQVPIFTNAEQGPTYEKINALLSHAYPNYTDNNLAQGTITKLKIGDYIDTFGVITNISHTTETNVQWSSGNLVKTLPQVITLNISMNVVHNKLPQRYLEAGERPFIAPGETFPNQTYLQRLEVQQIPNQIPEGQIREIPQRAELQGTVEVDFSDVEGVDQFTRTFNPEVNQ